MEDSTEADIMLSSRVKCLANEIYKEFDIIIKKHGENSIKNLMPLIVSILGSLEEYQVSKEELEINYNVLQEDQKHLLSEFEKEKNHKRSLQEKINKFEDFVEEVKREKDYDNSKASKNVKRLELSVKNLQDQLARYEERESDMKKANQKLHDRYSELLKSHAEYVDRTKGLAQIESLEKGILKPPISASVNNLIIQPKLVLSQPGKTNLILDDEFMDSPNFPNKYYGNSNSVRNEIELSSQHISVNQNESTKQRVIKSILETTPELNCDPDMSFSPNVYRNEEPNFDDLSMSGDVVSDGSQDPFGVTREIQNILRENQELIQDRNAFKVALDDLMTQVNKLENENTDLRDDLNSQLRAKSSMQIRIQDLEQENIGLRRQVETLQNEVKNQDEENVPYGKKMWFSRSEMSKMIIERNHFKMQLTELQNNIEWIEINKAEQRSNRKNTGTRKKISEMLFSMLFGQSGGNDSRNSSSSTLPNRYNVNNQSLDYSPNRSRDNTETLQSQRGDLYETTDNLQCNIDYVNPNLIRKSSQTPSKCNCYSGLFSKVDAYSETTIPGWDCPSIKSILKHQVAPSLSKELSNTEKFSSNQLIKQLVDLTSTPIFSRPIRESYPDMEIWRATATYRDTSIDIHEGVIRIGQSQFFERPSIGPTHRQQQKGLSSSMKYDGMDCGPRNFSTPKRYTTTVPTSSSLDIPNECSFEVSRSIGLPDERISETVWLCSLSTRSNSLRDETGEKVDVKSQITLVNLNEPKKVINTFGIVNSQVLSMEAAPAFNKSILDHLQSVNKYWQSLTFVADKSFLEDDLKTTPHDATTLNKSKSASLSDLGHLPETFRQVYSVHRIYFSPVSLNASTFSTGSTFATSHSSEPNNFSQETIKVNNKNATDAKHTESIETESNRANTNESNNPDESLNQGPVMPNTSQPTVWLGSQDGSLYVHSSISHYNQALATIVLPDSITAICYSKGKMFVSLANSRLYIFRRCIENKRPHQSTEDYERDGQSEIGTWDLSQAIVIKCGHPQYSIRTMTPIVNMDTIWVSYRNYILVIDTNNFQLLHVIQAHHKRDAQIKQMAWIADGVWVSIRRDSVIRLFHTYTYQHIQDVDIQSAILQTLSTNFTISQNETSIGEREKISNQVKRGGELTVTALLPTRDQLWISTNLGITITIPYSIYFNSQDRIEDIADDLNDSSVFSEYATIEDDNVSLGKHGDSSHGPKMVVAAKVEPAYLQISRYCHTKEVQFLLQIRAHGPPEAHSALSRHKFGLSSNFSQVLDYTSPDYIIKEKYSKIMVVSGGQGYQKLTKRNCPLHQNKDPSMKTSPNQEEKADQLKQNFLFIWLMPNNDAIASSPQRSKSLIS